jgi:hypothetical protein
LALTMIHRSSAHPTRATFSLSELKSDPLPGAVVAEADAFWLASRYCDGSFAAPELADDTHTTIPCGGLENIAGGGDGIAVSGVGDGVDSVVDLVDEVVVDPVV